MCLGACVCCFIAGSGAWILQVCVERGRIGVVWRTGVGISQDGKLV